MVLPQHPNASAPVLSHFSLQGKVAAVTGGVRGIGLEVSRALAEAGADVAVIYSTTKTADEIAAQLAQDTGAKVKAYRSKVEDKAGIAATLDQVVADFGKLDVVVANAGVCAHHPAEEYSEDDWRRNMSVNLDGAFYTAQAAANVFKKLQAIGNVIFTASVSATLVNVPQKQAAYNASKAAVVHLAKSLAVEWVDFCRVNCVSPGFIDTDMLSIHPDEWKKKWFEMIPGRRLADPAELKGVYVFLASNASSYMTGADLIIDGGYTLP
ncbi:uncharacterized protein K452DRAFT_277602 [Aplosporella prunicola CBS 121167]|uniref:NADP-dependent mannitol dehydrogenase n=1 Tax=Aplosporella prunicola CBS 121167 TaxID=1176127 RepID=A0A6A6B195_9PEZI|nr:uncharacterized protein K452DRAFT_277602 [Aplosporella prunicola CBS 121167]KAF2137972.1 hypothetical protein K452DRAFT_277602 [Aplosporella prunicola CBS 121167]